MASGSSNRFYIPGFIRDPESGRYFRERREDAKNYSFKKIKRRAELKTVTKVGPCKITNPLNFLKMRELGSLNGTDAESEFCKMILQNKKEVMSEELNFHINPWRQLQRTAIDSIEFLVGGEKSNFGLWNNPNGIRHRNLVMERNYFNYPDHQNMSYKIMKYRIRDMCECREDLLVCVYSHYMYNTSTLHCLPKYSQDDTLIFVEEALFSCSIVGNDRYVYAVGGEKSIRLFNVFDVYESIQLKARAHTLASEKHGKLLSAGLHNGTIRFFDTLNKSVAFDIKNLDTCIVESAFRENTPYAIFAGLPDKLFQVDLRTRKIVTTYSGHHQTQSKRHFSMTDNMLCTTGYDNIIRIWHMSGGNPIFEMEPIGNRRKNIRGWLNSDGNKKYLNYFEADCNKVFEII